MIYPIRGEHSQEEFAYTKGVIRIRKSKDRQRNGQKKKYKRTNNDLQIQNIHIKPKVGSHKPHYKPGVNPRTPEG